MSETLKRYALTDATLAQRFQKEAAQLIQNRTTWLAHWRELTEWMQPRRGQWLSTDTNRGEKRNDKIINGYATDTVEIAAAGMAEGLTPRTRRWFRFRVKDARSMQSFRVRAWLEQAQEIVWQVVSGSTLINAFPEWYIDLWTVGTACGLIDEDDEDIVRAHVLPIGSYALASSSDNRIDTVYREFQLTVADLVEKFGPESVRKETLDRYIRGELHAWVDVRHRIGPNRWLSPSYSDNHSMPWCSHYWESGADPDRFLEVSGYRSRPFVAPRWRVRGQNIYGDSLGMNALGDIRQLQKVEVEKLEALARSNRPPFGAPSTFKDKLSIVPGAVNTYDVTQGAGKIEPLYRPTIGLGDFRAEIEAIELRIGSTLRRSLFQFLLDSQRERTAYEVEKIVSEQARLVSPYIQRLDDELLDPAVSRVFDICLATGWIPPAPPEIAGAVLDIETVSYLALAYKRAELGDIERFMQLVALVAQSLGPAGLEDLADVVNVEALGRGAADALSLPLAYVNTAEEVAARREQRAKIARAQQALNAGAVGADAAKTLSETDMAKPSALQAVIGAAQQYTNQGAA